MKQLSTYEAFIDGNRIWQRLSTRRYTHALALTAFDPEVFRASWKKDFPGNAPNRIRYSRRIVQLASAAASTSGAACPARRSRSKMSTPKSPTSVG